MSDVSQTVLIWTLKGAGAAAGSALSLIYMLPATRREAAARFLAGVIAGLVFGSTVGLAIAGRLGVADRLGTADMVLMGSAATSVAAWWALGAVARIIGRLGRSAREQGQSKT